MKNHYQSFFGRKCGLILNSNYETEDFYLNFIQQKDNDEWESYKEGLNIKLNIKEICEISEILENENSNTRIIHKYGGEKKDFWLGFEKKKNEQVFSIKGRSNDIIIKNEIRSHQKSFFGGELRMLKKLWFHIENEFIEFTTKAKIRT